MLLKYCNNVLLILHTKGAVQSINLSLELHDREVLFDSRGDRNFVMRLKNIRHSF